MANRKLAAVAVLIIVIVIVAAIYSQYTASSTGQNTINPTSCTFPPQSVFNCTLEHTPPILFSTGTLLFTLTTSARLNITAVGCSSNQTPTHMEDFSGANQIKLSPGELAFIQSYFAQVSTNGKNGTFTDSSAPLLCYSNGSLFNETAGSVYHGYVILNYTMNGKTYQTDAQITLVSQNLPP